MIKINLDDLNLSVNDFNFLMSLSAILLGFLIFASILMIISRFR